MKRLIICIILFLTLPCFGGAGDVVHSNDVSIGENLDVTGTATVGQTLSVAGNVGFGGAALPTTFNFHSLYESATTNDIVEVARFQAESTGSPITGFGSSIGFYAEDNLGNIDKVGALEFHDSPSDFSIVVDVGAQIFVDLIKSSGDDIGFYNADDGKYVFLNIIGPGVADRTLTIDMGSSNRSIDWSGGSTFTIENTSAVNQDLTTDADPTHNDLTLSTPSNIYALSHDSFTDFVANEHIDWTNTSQDFNTSGEIAGGAIITGGNIGVAEDRDVLQLAANNLTVNGDGTFSGLIQANYFDLPEIAQPANPAANKLRIYVEAIQGFSFLKYLDDTGMKREFMRDSMLLAYNNSGSTIAANRIVYADASTGTVPEIKLAKADSIATMPAIGVTVETIANGAYGRVMQIGVLENVNTLAFTAGDILYVSDATAGVPTATAPVTPSLTQEIGTILVDNATTGSIQIVARGLTGDEYGTAQNVFYIGDGTAGTKSLIFNAVTDAQIDWDETKFSLGSDDILTSGTITGGSLVTGGNVGIAADTDLLSMAANALTINGNQVWTDNATVITYGDAGLADTIEFKGKATNTSGIKFSRDDGANDLVWALTTSIASLTVADQYNVVSSNEGIALTASTAGKDITLTSESIRIGGSNNELRFYEGANYVGFEAPALTGDQIWVLPTIDGSDGDVLTTNGSGTLSWLSGASEKAWTFTSPSGSSGTFYYGGYYDFAASDNDFNPAVNYGTVNASYAAHFFIVCAAGGVGGTDTVIRVTGTSITDEAVRTAADTEDLTADDAGVAGAYYETSKKWIGQVSVEKISGPDLLCNYGLCKYWDNNNSDYAVTGLEVTWLGGANDASPNILLRHHKTSGWTYNAASTPTPPSAIADMNTDHNTEIQVVNGENGAWKRTNLSTNIAGSGSEGTIWEIVTTSNKTFELGNILMRITPQ